MSTCVRLASLSIVLLLTAASSGRLELRAEQEQSPTVRGQTATVLSDGSVLLLGGEGRTSEVRLYDPSTRRTRAAGKLRMPRAWHTATTLPDGSVLVVGGIGTDGQIVQDAERYDPATGEVAALADASFTPRAHHTSTLLTDGRVLLVGGETPGGGGVRAGAVGPADEHRRRTPGTVRDEPA